MATNAAPAKGAGKTKKGWLPRDYRDNNTGKTYGPGFAEVPADSTVATFFQEPPQAYLDAQKADAAEAKAKGKK